MKYVSLDIETSALDPKTPENILMISMVVEDSSDPRPLNELPHFTRIIKQSEYTGQAYALGLNGWIFDIISGRVKDDRYEILDGRNLAFGISGELVFYILEFLNLHFNKDEKVTLAGKNVAGFDFQFLPESVQRRFHARMIDPGSMFMDWNEPTLPSLGDIKKKLGMEEEVAHDAYEDALDVIRILRTTYQK